MGLLECICGYGVAPTADDRIAKAMQTFNLKARSRCLGAVSLHYYESSPSDEVVGGRFFEFEPFRGASERPPRCPAARRKKI